MKPKRFLISSLLVAGLIPPLPAKASLPQEGCPEPQKNKATLFDVFKRNHQFDLAGHRSHSSYRSHRSHVSHSSHRSSSTGGYLPPTYTPPPALYTPPPVAKPMVAAPAVTSKFTAIVLQVQSALFACGYYSGALTGVVDAATKLALSDMQPCSACQ